MVRMTNLALPIFFAICTIQAPVRTVVSKNPLLSTVGGDNFPLLESSPSFLHGEQSLGLKEAAQPSTSPANIDAIPTESRPSIGSNRRSRGRPQKYIDINHYYKSNLHSERHTVAHSTNSILTTLSDTFRKERGRPRIYHGPSKFYRLPPPTDAQIKDMTVLELINMRPNGMRIDDPFKADWIRTLSLHPDIQAIDDANLDAKDYAKRYLDLCKDGVGISVGQKISEALQTHLKEKQYSEKYREDVINNMRNLRRKQMDRRYYVRKSRELTPKSVRLSQLDLYEMAKDKAHVIKAAKFYSQCLQDAGIDPKGLSPQDLEEKTRNLQEWYGGEDTDMVAYMRVAGFEQKDIEHASLTRSLINRDRCSAKKTGQRSQVGTKKRKGKEVVAETSCGPPSSAASACAPMDDHHSSHSHPPQHSSTLYSQIYDRVKAMYGSSSSKRHTNLPANQDAPRVNVPGHMHGVEQSTSVFHHTQRPSSVHSKPALDVQGLHSAPSPNYSHSGKIDTEWMDWLDFDEVSHPSPQVRK